MTVTGIQDNGTSSRREQEYFPSELNVAMQQADIDINTHSVGRIICHIVCIQLIYISLKM